MRVPRHFRGSAVGGTGLETKGSSFQSLHLYPISMGYTDQIRSGWASGWVLCVSSPERQPSSQVLGFRLWTPLRPSQLAVPLVVGASALGGAKSRLGWGTSQH